MKKVFALTTCIALAGVCMAAPRPHIMPGLYMTPRTNAFELFGVKMPAKFSVEQWNARREIIERFRTELDAYDAKVYEQWSSELNDRQRWALREQSATNEWRFARMQSEAKRRYDEVVLFTNRMAYVKSDFTDRRRREIEYRPGLTWNGEKVVKSVFYSAEGGKVKVEMLYTLDAKGREKKQRIDFDAIVNRMKGARR